MEKPPCMAIASHMQLATGRATVQCTTVRLPKIAALGSEFFLVRPLGGRAHAAGRRACHELQLTV